MPDERLREGRKDPNRVAGAPFPPAREHHDSQDRPARQVPTAPGSDDEEPHEEDPDGP